MKLFLSYVLNGNNTIRLLSSKEHEIEHHIFNYSGSPFEMDGAIVHQSENIERHRDNVRQKLLMSKSDVLIPIDPNTILYDGAIDRLITKHMTDDSYGSAYSDFYIVSKDGIRIHVLHKSLPSGIGMHPVIAFKTKAMREYSYSNNPEGDILAKLVSKHIPEPLGEFLE